MARGSRRKREEALPDDLRGEGAPFPDSLADEVLDHPARLLESGLTRLDQYADLIHTGLIDSRVPFRGHFPSRSSSLVRARATYRSAGRAWFNVKTLISPPLLARRALACAKRSIRREVLFALKKRGKGSGAKRRVWKFDSSWRC